MVESEEAELRGEPMEIDVLLTSCTFLVLLESHSTAL